MPHWSKDPVRRAEVVAKISAGKQKAHDSRIEWELEQARLGVGGVVSRKLCTRCGEWKGMGEFGRMSRKLKSGRIRSYPRPACLRCDAARTAERVARMKSTREGLRVFRAEQRRAREKRARSRFGRERLVWLDPWPLCYWLSGVVEEGEMHDGGEGEALRQRLAEACLRGRVEYGVAERCLVWWGGLTTMEDLYPGCSGGV